MKKPCLLVLAFALAACGGKIDGDDGGTSSNDGGTSGLDASAKKDAVVLPDVGPPTPPCTPITGGGTVGSNGDCEATASWSCGDTHYNVDCSCPSAQCTCSMMQTNGSGSGEIVKEPNICPGCGGDLPSICNFPH